ncbi:indolepyruvate oxidoreductase subunit beta [Thermoanaerobacterium sp. DL9XJH110]|uniref:indolepyruvate oxidoreductase subunit beta n=1 Tax=Thermoanaerobacterium sp. DL9XJH110 TaxID=3386643 RepID=UPI003BB521BD
MANTGVLIAGVGGQGTLLASRILGEVALKKGFDVKVSEVHGMAQRGGGVVTHVRFGERIYSPLVGKGQADYILAFEKLEALRWAEYLKKTGTFIVNNHELYPVPVTLGYQKYPAGIEVKLAETAETLIIDARKMAARCGSVKAQNVVLLGVLAGRLDFEKELWEETIKNTVPPSTVEVNLRAFEEGFRAACKGLE